MTETGYAGYFVFTTPLLLFSLLFFHITQDIFGSDPAFLIISRCIFGNGWSLFMSFILPSSYPDKSNAYNGIWIGYILLVFEG